MLGKCFLRLVADLATTLLSSSSAGTLAPQEAKVALILGKPLRGSR